MGFFHFFFFGLGPWLCAPAIAVMTNIAFNLDDFETFGTLETCTTTAKVLPFVVYGLLIILIFPLHIARLYHTQLWMILAYLVLFVLHFGSWAAVGWGMRGWWGCDFDKARTSGMSISQVSNYQEDLRDIGTLFLAPAIAALLTFIYGMIFMHGWCTTLPIEFQPEYAEKVKTGEIIRY
eukprot:Clim_evm9s6 gene=Clim_evmTU9s6